MLDACDFKTVQKGVTHIMCGHLRECQACGRGVALVFIILRWAYTTNQKVPRARLKFARTRLATIYLYVM